MAPAQEPTKIKQDLSKHFILNLVALVVDYAGNVLVSFFLNPQVLGMLGSVQFGIWQVLSRMINYLSTPGGKPAQALKFAMSKAQHNSDDETRQRLVGNGVATWLLFSPFYLVGGVAISLGLPYLMKVPPELVDGVRLAVVVLAISVFLREAAQIPGAVLAGMNLGYKMMGLKASSHLVRLSVALLLLWQGWQLTGLATAHVAGGLFLGFVGLWITKRALPWFRARRPDRDELKSFVKFNAWYLCWRLLDMCLRTSDVLMVGFVLGAEMVTNYTLTNFAPVLVLTMASHIIGASMPGVGGLLGTGAYERVRNIRVEVLTLVWLGSLAYSCATMLLNKTFLVLWIPNGETHYGGDVWTILFMLTALQQAINQVDSSIINANMDLKQKFKLTLITLSCTFALSIPGLYLYGVPGLLIGFMLGRGVQTIGYPIMVGKAISVSVGQQLKGLIRPLLTTAVMLGIFGLVLPGYQLIQTKSWIIFVLSGGVIAVVSGIIALLIGVSKAGRTRVLKRLKRLAKR